MTDEELQDLVEEIRNGRTEDTATEWKGKWWNLKNERSRQEFIKDISAMGNAETHDPRVIIVGIDSAGRINDSPLPEDEAQLQELLKIITPIPTVKFEQKQIEQKTVTVVSIRPPFDQPYVAKVSNDNFIWVRMGSSTSTVSRNQLDRYYKVKKRHPGLEPMLWEWIDWHGDPTRVESLEFMTIPELSLEKLHDALRTEMTDVTKLDGSVDPRWAEKMGAFISNCQKFLSTLQDNIEFEKWYINSYFRLAKMFTVSIYNGGTKQATQIRANVVGPEWLHLCKHPPKDKDIPVRPRPPIPRPPQPTSEGRMHMTPVASALRDKRDPSVYYHSPSVKPTWGVYIDNNGILQIWSDTLLHKHCIRPAESFFAVALPDAPIGTHEISVDVLCAELENWESKNISIHVTASDEATALGE